MMRRVVAMGMSIMCVAASHLGAQAVRATISGTVYDSLGQQFLDSAVVQLVRADAPGHGRSRMPDGNGRFHFDSIEAGRWILGFIHPAIDTLGIAAPLLQVTVRTAEPIQAALAVPSAATIVRNTCGTSADSAGLWFGYTRSAIDGEVMPGAFVQAQWSRIRVVGTSIQHDVPVLQQSSSDEGVFQHCFMPTEEIVLARAWRNADSSGAVTFTLPAGGLLKRDMYVAPIRMTNRRVPSDSGSDSTIVVPLRTGEGRLVGRVTRAGGQGVRGARIRFMDTGHEAITNDNGYFGLDSLPLGSHSLDARALGFVSALRSVDIIAGRTTSLDLELANRQVFLDTVKVVGRRLADTKEYLDFTRRQRAGFGRFWDEDRLARSNAFYVSDLFRMTLGATVLPGGRVLFRADGHGGYCQPTVFLDGMRFSAMEDLPLDAFVNVDNIRAMEAYTRNLQVPAEFRTATNCGAIAIWTGVRTRSQLK